MRSKASWVLLVIAISVLCLISLSQKGESSSSVQWEYRILRISNREAHNSEPMLNELGTQGWELVQTQGDDRTSVGGGVYYFKRRR